MVRFSRQNGIELLQADFEAEPSVREHQMRIGIYLPYEMTCWYTVNILSLERRYLFDRSKQILILDRFDMFPWVVEKGRFFDRAKWNIPSTG